MTANKDFTIKQAVAWVAQEASKHDTAESISERISAEESFIAMLADIGTKFPNSAMAHEKLAELLRVKLANLEAA